MGRRSVQDLKELVQQKHSNRSVWDVSCLFLDELSQYLD